jgi:hypothetical protein
MISGEIVWAKQGKYPWWPCQIFHYSPPLTSHKRSASHVESGKGRKKGRSSGGGSSHNARCQTVQQRDRQREALGR